MPNIPEFLDDLRRDAQYADQIVHIHETPPRDPDYAPDEMLSPDDRTRLRRIGFERLYAHQGQAVAHILNGDDVIIATGTASGKSLCYVLPTLRYLAESPEARVLALFPTKALCQDQFQSFHRALAATGQSDVLVGVFDGDTPPPLRRKLRDRARVLFSNPDMLHAAVMPQHARWAEMLSNLKLIVLDELHVYNGIFGSNMALVLKRFLRLCRHYGSSPSFVACSATIANPQELALRLTGRSFDLVDRDASPCGRRTYVFWNPPRIRGGHWRSRRSANVEAHELMASLIQRGLPTITFSKAKMTAEMIHRYVRETLTRETPHLATKITPYRGGYLPEERRAIEARLFNGELMGVSTTAALELGIDVGAFAACIMIGYPGTLASFFQQSGRAGRKADDALVFLVGLDTSINQFILSSPDYIFGRHIEQAVIDAANPFVEIGHLRCACFELPLSNQEAATFGPHAPTALRVLETNHKLKHIQEHWYHAATETPHHEVPLRDYADANVVIEDKDSGQLLGEVNKYDAEPILHPGAVYLHHGDTFLVRELDLERNIATVQREEVNYYTQPLGGTDIHHIDHQLREKPFGTGRVCWGEVTAYFNTHAYERIHFYSLDAISVHELELPTMVLETMAFWIIPPDSLLDALRASDLDAHSGLRGIGYATRMLLPLFITCRTLDFSHTVGSANSPWQSVFVYERYPHGLGFTENAYHQMHIILPAVLEAVRQCPCEEGCPCCVGKPLRGYSTWDVQRGEASIPSKAAAIYLLEGLMPPGVPLVSPDTLALTETDEASEQRLEQSLRRRLERMREPQVFHRIRPRAEIETATPATESPELLDTADVARRTQRRRTFDRDLHKRLAKKLTPEGLHPHTHSEGPPPGTHKVHANRRPTDFVPAPEPAAKRAGNHPDDLRTSDLGTSGTPARPQPQDPPGSPRGASGSPAAPARPHTPEIPRACLPRRGPDRAKTGPGESQADGPAHTPPHASTPVVAGDTLAARARQRLKRSRRPDPNKG